MVRREQSVQVTEALRLLAGCLRKSRDLAAAAAEKLRTKAEGPELVRIAGEGNNNVHHGRDHGNKDCV